MGAVDKKRHSREKVSIYFLVCKSLTIDEVGEGVEVHRIAGDTAGSWFLKPAISSKKR